MDDEISIIPLQDGMLGDDSLYFSKHDNDEDITTVLNSGNHVIKYATHCPRLLAVNEDLFIDTSSFVLMFIIILSSSIVGVLAAFPYATYHAWITSIEWIFFCVIRATVFACVFTSQWVFTIFDIVHRPKQTIRSCTIMRHIVCTLFAALYSVLYAIKWMELDNIILWQLTIGLFTISWFNVFYGVINYRLGSSTVFMSTSTNLRVRSIILSCIKAAERIAWKSADDCNSIMYHLKHDKHIGVFIAKQSNSLFYTYPLSGDKLEMYENAVYDMYASTRTSFIDLFVGLSLVPLTLALLEDYGYSLYKMCHTLHCVDTFDWVVFICTSILAILYTIATYDIHHNNARKCSSICQTKQDMIGGIKKLFVQSFPLACACIVGTTRLNSSYSIFGRIAGKFDMPYSIGLPFIYTMIGVVFIIDTAAAYKIVCRSYKKMISILILPIISWSSYLPSSINHIVQYYYLRYYYKRLKWYVKNCDEQMICVLQEHLL